MTDQRETLTRRASEHYVDRAIAQFRRLPDPRAARFCGIGANDGTVREIEFMHGAMNRIDLNRSRHIETCLLETERQSARTRKQVDSDRTPHCIFNGFS